MDIRSKINALREPGRKLVSAIRFTFEGSTLGPVLPEQIAGFAFGLYEPIDWDANGNPIRYREVILIISSDGSHERVPATSTNMRIIAEIQKIKANSTHGNPEGDSASR